MSIEVAQSLLPGTINTPLDARTRIADLAEMETISNPFLGMEIFCTATGKTYKIRTLKSKMIGSLNVANAQIDTYEEIPDAEDLAAVTSRLETLESGGSGTASSAGYAASAGSVPWEGITGKPSAFPPDETLLTSLLAAGGSAGQVLIHTGSSYTWQDADLSSGGTTGEGGGIATSKALITELNAGGCMVVPGAPAYIETNSGNLYPVSGGFVSSSSEGYLIDPVPYLLADGQASFTGTWTVYLLQIKEAENG